MQFHTMKRTVRRIVVSLQDAALPKGLGAFFIWTSECLLKLDFVVSHNMAEANCGFVLVPICCDMFRSRIEDRESSDAETRRNPFLKWENMITPCVVPWKQTEKSGQRELPE